MPSMDGAILFLEDQRVVGLGTIDRQLTQLIESGSLDGVAGVALGSFEGFRDYSDRGWTIVDVLADRLGALGVPVLGGLPAGHDLVGADGTPDQMAVPLGSLATLDTETGTLTVDPIVADRGLCHAALQFGRTRLRGRWRRRCAGRRAGSGPCRPARPR